MDTSKMLVKLKTIALLLIATLFMKMAMTVPKTEVNYHIKTLHHTKSPGFKLNGPKNTTLYKFEDDYDTLIDLKQFKFVIKPRNCHQEDLLLLIMIPTRPQSYELRFDIRSIWRQHLDSMKLVFLLGLSSNKTIEEKIKEEDKIYGDIIQGNLIDVYKNLTYKHIMGLKWGMYHCSTARFILKLDDDVFVHVKNLRSFLFMILSSWGARDLIACRPCYDREVKRTGKWAVSEAEIPERLYPEYCMGYFILYSRNVARRLLERVQKLPYLWIEDVQITGYAARDINVTITPVYDMAITYRHSDELMEEAQESNSTLKYFSFGPNLTSDKMMREMWKMVILNDVNFAKWKNLIGRHKPKCFLPKKFRLSESLPSEDFPEDCDMGLFMKGWKLLFKQLKILSNATKIIVGNKTYR